jgi:hypothetical protein
MNKLKVVFTTKFGFELRGRNEFEEIGIKTHLFMWVDVSQRYRETK